MDMGELSNRFVVLVVDTGDGRTNPSTATVPERTMIVVEATAAAAAVAAKVSVRTFVLMVDSL